MRSWLFPIILCSVLLAVFSVEATLVAGPIKIPGPKPTPVAAGPMSVTGVTPGSTFPPQKLFWSSAMSVTGVTPGSTFPPQKTFWSPPMSVTGKQ
jgi:hypothetical protein